MAGLLNTAVTGLKVSQTALSTTGHNIANANTAGYSRQRVESETSPANVYGSHYIGTGTRVSAIERIVDEFVVTQLREDTSLNSEFSAYTENIKQIDTLLSDSSTGLSGGLETFFAALETGADDPTSIPSRELIISEAENLTQRFNTLYERLSDIADNVNQKLSVAVSQINAIAENIAQLNVSIAQALGSTGKSPNDLLDQREEALRQLSELVDIDVIEQTDGSVNVAIGTGQSLVTGSLVREISVGPGEEDPQSYEISYNDRLGSQSITQFLTGGEIGGIIQFRDEVLDTSFNELGRVAIVLSDAINEVHKQGIDLNDNFGGDFFLDVNDTSLVTRRVISASSNAQPNDRVMALEITDSSQLTISDYQVEVSDNSTNYTITRESDGAIVYKGALPTNYPQTVEFDGLALTFVSGSFQEGDTFTLQPTRTAARDFETVVERADELAFASPLVTGADEGNIGNASITSGSLTNLEGVDGADVGLFTADGSIATPLLVVFTSPTTYDVLDNSDPGNPVQLSPPVRNQPYIPGQTNQLFTSDVGQTIVAAEGAGLGMSAITSGASPLAAPANGYGVETLTFRYIDADTGRTSEQSVVTAADASAAEIAAQLSNLDGVSAIARNSASLTDFSGLTRTSPLQISVNGVDLIEYNSGVLDAAVPDPAADPAAFNDYLAERINEEAALADLGISAIAGTNATTGLPELRISSTKGDDLNLSLTAGAGESMTVADYNGGSGSLVATGAGNETAVTVGGTLDVTMASGISMRTNPTVSTLFGDSSAADFAQSSYFGIEASISGVPETGDRFTLNFNESGISDNRNALALVNLYGEDLVEDGSRTLAESYATLIEFIGINTNAAEINLEAASQVLTQTEDLRNSLSGVNLDEEAANLIQFEQVYNANAQVISVARDLFDRLINSF